MLRRDDFKEKLKPIRTQLQDALERYIRLLKVLDREKKNIEYLNQALPPNLELVNFSLDGNT